MSQIAQRKMNRSQNLEMRLLAPHVFASLALGVAPRAGPSEELAAPSLKEDIRTTHIISFKAGTAPSVRSRLMQQLGDDSDLVKFNHVFLGFGKPLSPAEVELVKSHPHVCRIQFGRECYFRLIRARFIMLKKTKEFSLLVTLNKRIRHGASAEYHIEIGARLNTFTTKSLEMGHAHMSLIPESMILILCVRFCCNWMIDVHQSRLTYSERRISAAGPSRSSRFFRDPKWTKMVMARMLPGSLVAQLTAWRSRRYYMVSRF